MHLVAADAADQVRDGLLAQPLVIVVICNKNSIRYSLYVAIGKRPKRTWSLFRVFLCLDPLF